MLLLFHAVLLHGCFLVSTLFGTSSPTYFNILNGKCCYTYFTGFFIMQVKGVVSCKNQGEYLCHFCGRPVQL